MMSLLSRIGLRRRSEPPPLSQLGPPPSQVSGSGSQVRSRRELLRVVLRDTLNRHGIPAAWFDAEVLVSTSRTGERGIHWRLVVKNADPRLLTHAVALQHALIKRLTTFDPLASAWLTGISWQYALPDDAVHAPLPPPASWREAPGEASAVAATALPGRPDGASAAAASGEFAAQQARQDAIDARADLEGLFAARDADFKRHSSGEDATQPMFLGTEPAKL